MTPCKPCKRASNNRRRTLKKRLAAASMNVEPLTGEALEREQMRRNQRRWRAPRLHFNRFMLTSKCPCECGLKFTTKGIAQHQRRCAVYQAKWGAYRAAIDSARGSATKDGK